MFHAVKGIRPGDRNLVRLQYGNKREESSARSPTVYQGKGTGNAGLEYKGKLEKTSRATRVWRGKVPTKIPRKGGVLLRSVLGGTTLDFGQKEKKRWPPSRKKPRDKSRFTQTRKTIATKRSSR